MKSFKIKLPDYSETEVEVNSKYTVQQLIQHIKDIYKDKKWVQFDLELYLFDQVLNNEGSVDKIIHNQSTDYLQLKLKKGEQKKKLKSFFEKAVVKIKEKTEDKLQGFQKSLHKSQTFQEQPKANLKPNVKKLLSFFQEASFRIAEGFKNKVQNFQNNINLKASNKTASQDPSRIHLEEDPIKNNDTVIGLLDDMHPVGKRDKRQQSLDSHAKPKSLSPEARRYLERKKYALEKLNDPNSKEKAKKLVAELQKQRKELEERRQKQKLDESEKLEESIQHYKFEREQEKEYVNNEKRERIKERLAELQKHQEIKSQMNEQQKQLIQALKNKEKEKKRQLEEKEEILKKQYYEDAKVKLQQRKKLAVPIRLEEINKHEEDYLNKKQLLKLEKDQKKLEREITIQQETKQNYRSLQFLTKVMESDQKMKNKETMIKQQNAEKLMRKQKYAEIVKEYHKPALKIQTDNQFAKGVHNKSDNSIQEEYVDFLKEGEGKQSPNKFDSIRNKLQKQSSQGQEKNFHKIQNILNQQKIQKTKITEQLQKGYMPDPSVYYQPKSFKTDIQSQEPESKKKPIDYLKELEKQRAEQEKSTQQSNSVPRLNQNQNQNSIIEISRRYEKIAKRKEHQAFYLKDDKLKEEADELLFKSVQQKIKFLEKQ